MSDLIDRQATIDVVFDEGCGMCAEAIKDMPESVVRCKDCKNWVPGYIKGEDDFKPPRCGKYQQAVGHSSDDFCSLAERGCRYMGDIYGTLKECVKDGVCEYQEKDEEMMLCMAIEKEVNDGRPD